MNEEISYFQGKWSDLVTFINEKQIKREQIQTINTFIANVEDVQQVFTVMFYWEAKE